MTTRTSACCHNSSELSPLQLLDLRDRFLLKFNLVWQALIGLNSAGTDFDFVGPYESRIAFVAVGLTGCQTVETLQQRLRSTPEESRPGAALVVEAILRSVITNFTNRRWTRSYIRQTTSSARGIFSSRKVGECYRDISPIVIWLNTVMPLQPVGQVISSEL